MSTVDPTELLPTEFHPAALQAYRWLKGFMITNEKEYIQFRLALSIAADHGNRHAQVCMGTIERLQNGQPVSDRYLMGLAWTFIYLLNQEYIDGIAEQRLDPANPPDETEFKL